MLQGLHQLAKLLVGDKAVVVSSASYRGDDTHNKYNQSIKSQVSTLVELKGVPWAIRVRHVEVGAFMLKVGGEIR